MLSRPIQTLSRHNLLTALVQTNIAAYVIGMITLLKLTQVYWDEAWLFLLPMAAAFGGLGLLFAGFATIQMTWLLAAVLCLTLGLIAALSPLWLPVFLAMQALIMLAGARGRYSELWQALSLLVLGYACAHLVTNGQVDILDLSSPEKVTFPWWTYASVTAIALAYAITWERRLAAITKGLAPVGHFLVSFIAVLVWANALQQRPAASGFVYHTAAIPIAALAAVFARARCLSIFIFGTIIIALVNFSGLRAVIREDSPWQPWVTVIALAGLASAFLTEKRGTGDLAYDRWTWRALYAWSQFILAISLTWNHPETTRLWLLTLVVAATLTLAWFLRSAALGKSAFITGLFLAIATPDNPYAMFACAAIIAACAYPVGLNQWTRRTGDTSPLITLWGQAALVLIAGFMAFQAFDDLHWNLTISNALVALLAAAYAAAGRFAPVIASVLLFAFGVLILLLDQLDPGMRFIVDKDAPRLMAATWSIIGVLLLVAAERLLRFAPRHSLPLTNPARRWITPRTQSLLTTGLAIATLIMAILAVRTLPDLRLFYFTGAMVAAAFLWIVFGFWFNESAYRKAGFVFLCLGIVKGLIWDVLSLKNTFYRIVSWSILGLLAIAASFLYTRFRTRLTHTEGE